MLLPFVGLPSPEIIETNEIQEKRITRSTTMNDETGKECYLESSDSSEESEKEQEDQSQKSVETQNDQVPRYVIPMRRRAQLNDSQYSVPALRRGQRNRKAPTRFDL